MAYFAIIGEDNIVKNTVKVSNTIATTEEAGVLFLKDLYKDQNLVIRQTSYNTFHNQHRGPDLKPDGGVALRGNYAEPGYIYDPVNDVFYRPRPLDMNGLPCNSWTLSSLIWDWKPPIPYPNVEGKVFYWNEQTQEWVEVNYS